MYILWRRVLHPYHIKEPEVGAISGIHGFMWRGMRIMFSYLTEEVGVLKDGKGVSDTALFSFKDVDNI